MLGPAAADNGPFWAGSEVESVTAQSHRPHVAKGIKQCTPEVTEHNSKRKTLATTIMCHHQSRRFLKKGILLPKRIKSNSYKLQLSTFLNFFHGQQARGFKLFLISAMILSLGDSFCHQCQGHWAVKLVSGRALSTAEGTQTSHRLSLRPALKKKKKNRSQIYVWELGASGERLQQRFSLNYDSERELTFGATTERSAWLLHQLLLTRVSSSTFPSSVIRECIRCSGLTVATHNTLLSEVENRSAYILEC